MVLRRAHRSSSPSYTLTFIASLHDPDTSLTCNKGSMTAASSLTDVSSSGIKPGLPHIASGRHNTDDPSQLQTIDFSASRAFFADLESLRPPTHASNLGYDQKKPGPNANSLSPNNAIPGRSPVSKLGSLPNRAFARHQPVATGSSKEHAGPVLDLPNGVDINAHPLPNVHPNRPTMPIYCSSYNEVLGNRQAQAINHGHRIDESLSRAGKPEHPHGLREEKQEPSTPDRLKQPHNDTDEPKMQKDEAARRTAETVRRNKLLAEERIARRLAVQKQVEDGINATKLQKESKRARVEEERKACRKWLSRLRFKVLASASATTSEPVDLYAAIGCQLRGLWQDSRPASSIQAQREEVVADVQHAITRKWPGQGLQVAAFGSSVTGLVTRTSDLDLVLLDPTRPYGAGTPSELCRPPHGYVRQGAGLPEWYSVHQIAKIIRNSDKFNSVVAISGANVPIVKMVHRKHNIPADININERFGLFNSQLISAYADLQPNVVRPLIFFLKHWFSRRDLNDPAGKRGSMTFSSYSITLMAIQVLQIAGLLPNLQSSELLHSLRIRPKYLYSRPQRPRRGKGVRRDAVEDATPPTMYDVTFASNKVNLADAYGKKAVEAVTGVGTSTSTSVGGLDLGTDRLLGRMLVMFVRFYAQLDRQAQAISVVNGAPLQRQRGPKPRNTLVRSTSKSGDANPRNDGVDAWAGDELVVQDPFIVDRNTTRNIKLDSIERWQSEMQRAMELLVLSSNSGETSTRRLEDVPLILDLCIPQDVLLDMQDNGYGSGGSSCAGSGAAPKEPWKLKEEAAARKREIAKQVAQVLRREKRKEARSAKRREAQLLQEEAAMVEDMIDGIETGRITGLTSGNRLHERWQLRMDNDYSNGGEPLPPIPFTFSVARPSGASLAARNTSKKADTSAEMAMSPTEKVGMGMTDSSSSSEDIDLVASRLQQEARLA